MKNYISYFPTVLYNFTLFSIFKKQVLFYDLFKILNTIVCCFFVYRFGRDYMSMWTAFVFTFFFIFFPTHDATNYWIIGQYLMITISLVFFSHHLINHSKFKSGLLFGVLGAFYSYASPPTTIGLSVLFIFKKEYKKFGFFICPQILYFVYYYVITRFINTTSTIRDGNIIDCSTFIKHYFIQVVSFVDVFFGLSFFLKIYNSILSLTLPSSLVGLVVIFLFFRNYKTEKRGFNWHLFIASGAVVLSSFVIFSLTGGHYIQMAFNLGNRVTIYGSFFVSLLFIVVFMKRKWSATIMFSIVLLSVLGISDHWKSWSASQKSIMNNVGKNKALQRIAKSEQVFIIHNHYSRLGEIDHIEYLSSGTERAIFNFASNKKLKIVSLKRNFLVRSNTIIDPKYDMVYRINKDFIWVYDTKEDRVFKVTQNDLKYFISSLDKNKRHWIQLLSKEHFAKKIILNFIPRLEYLF